MRKWVWFYLTLFLTAVFMTAAYSVSAEEYEVTSQWKQQIVPANLNGRTACIPRKKQQSKVTVTHITGLIRILTCRRINGSLSDMILSEMRFSGTAFKVFLTETDILYRD